RTVHAQQSHMNNFAPHIRRREDKTLRLFSSFDGPKPKRLLAEKLIHFVIRPAGADQLQRGKQKQRQCAKPKQPETQQWLCKRIVIDRSRFVRGIVIWINADQVQPADFTGAIDHAQPDWLHPASAHGYAEEFMALRRIEHRDGDFQAVLFLRLRTLEKILAV